jgi:hypothetical protein
VVSVLGEPDVAVRRGSGDPAPQGAAMEVAAASPVRCAASRASNQGRCTFRLIARGLYAELADVSRPDSRLLSARTRLELVVEIVEQLDPFVRIFAGSMMNKEVGLERPCLRAFWLGASEARFGCNGRGLQH